MCSGISNHTWPTLKDSAERDYELLRLNNNPKRKSYNLFNNHCGTFGFDVINQDPNINLPTLNNPAPNVMSDKMQDAADEIYIYP